MSIVDQTKKMMQNALEHLKQDFRSMRSNRANPGILDGVFVEIYGSQMKLKEIANVTAPEARQLLITPFDPQTVNMIAKSIEKANLNIQPIADGYTVRINIPPMDENTRKEIAKQAKKKGEEAKIQIRDIRKKNNDVAKKQKNEGLLTEDMVKKTEKNIQELTDQFCKEIDQLVVIKEKEVMTV
ncbi:MAG: ribosome recycling factor [Rhabdochlamydiaceae bacterium]